MFVIAVITSLNGPMLKVFPLIYSFTWSKDCEGIIMKRVMILQITTFVLWHDVLRILNE